MDGERIRVVVDADADPYVREFRRANAETRAFGRTVNSQSRGAAAFNAALAKQRQSLAGLATFARRAGVVVGGALVLALGDAVRTGMEFETQMARVKAVTKATGAEMDQLRALAMRLGADTKFSAGESAEAMYQLASAGFSIGEMEGAIEGTLSLAAASNIELADAAEISSNALRGFGLTADESTHVADVLAEAVNKSSVEMSHLQLTMKYIGPIAKATGQSFESMVAAVGLMGDAGIKGEQAGTALRAGLLRLTKPIGQTKKGLHELGLSAEDVQGPKGLLPLPALVAKLEDGMEGLSRSEQNAALSSIFGQEAMSGMYELVDAGPEKLRRLTKEYRASDGAAKDAAETMNDTVSGAFEQLTGSIETTEIALYEQFKVPLKEALMDATEFVNVQGKQLQDAIQATLDSPEFDRADFGGKVEMLVSSIADEWRDSGLQEQITEVLVDAFDYALPRVAEAAGHAALTTAKAFATGFVQADSLGRLVIGAWLFSKLGGFAALRAAGALAGGEVATGMAAGIAGSAGASGAAGAGGAAVAGGAAAGGVVSKLRSIKWGRIGAIGLGLVLADNTLNEFKRRTEEHSGDVIKELQAKIEGTEVGLAGTPLKINLHKNTGSLFDPFSLLSESREERFGKNITAQYEEMTQKRVKLSEATIEGIRAQAKEVGLTKEARAQVAQMLQLAESGRQLNIATKLGMDPASLAAIKTNMSELRSGLLTSMEDISTIFGRNRQVIARTLGAGTKEGRQAMARNMRAAVVAIEKGMADGEIKTKVGLRRQKQLLRDAKLITGADPFGIAQGFRDSWREAGRINAEHRAKAIEDLGKMPPAARQQAFETMVQFGRGLVKAKKIPERDLKTFISKAIARYQSLNPPVKRSSDRFAGIIGGAFGEAAQLVWKALSNIEDNTTGALKGLGAQQIAKFQLEKASARHRFSSGYEEGGIVPGTLDGDRFKTELQANSFVLNREAATAFGLGRQSGGRIPVELEGGERVFGPEQVRRVGLPKLEAMNAAVPRHALQEGGIVALGRQLQREGYEVGEHPAFGGVDPVHEPNSYHYSGQALDVNDDSPPFAAGGGEPGSLDQLYQRLKGMEGIVELLWKVSGHFDHLHVAMAKGASGFLGGAFDMPKPILLGPEPLRGLGQGSIDQVYEAAKRYVAAQARKTGAEPGVTLSGSGNVERIFADTARRLSTSKTATLALGEAGYAESGMRDLSYGDSSSTGALQLLASTASSLGIDPHDEAAISSTFLTRGFWHQGANRSAAQGLSAHMAAQEAQGSNYPDGSNYLAQEGAAKAWMRRYGLQLGGIVGLAEGGSPEEKQKERRKRKKRVRHNRRRDGGTTSPPGFGYSGPSFSDDAETVLETGFGPLPSTVSGCTRELNARRKQVEELRDALRAAKVGERRAAAEEDRAERQRDNRRDQERDRAEKHKERVSSLPPLPPIEHPSKAMRKKQRTIEKAIQRVKDRIKHLIEYRGRLLKRGRKKLSSRISSRGDLPGWSKQILDARDRYERRQEFADQVVGLEPSEMTEDYVDREEAAYKAVLGTEGGWRNLLIRGTSVAERRGEALEDQVGEIRQLRRKHPRAWRKNRWRIPALREGARRAREKRDEFAEELEEVQGVGGSKALIPKLPTEPKAGKFGGFIWDTQVAIKDLDLKIDQPESDTGSDNEDERNRIELELTQQALSAERLKNAQLGTLRDFLGEFGGEMPYLGAFMRGIRRVPHDGLAVLHRGEEVVPDSKGPAGTQLGGGAGGSSGPVSVQLVLGDKTRDLVQLIDARVDGRVAKIDQTIGRRGRQLSVAPGR